MPPIDRHPGFARFRLTRQSAGTSIPPQRWAVLRFWSSVGGPRGHAFRRPGRSWLPICYNLEMYAHHADVKGMATDADYNTDFSETWLDR